jgi:hypothetical protein
MGNPKADFSDLEDLRPRESTLCARRGGVRGPVSLIGCGLTAGVSCSFTLTAFFPHDQTRTLRAVAALRNYRAAMAARGNTTAREYGARHQALRRQAAALVKAGRALCWRCRLPIHPGRASTLATMITTAASIEGQSTNTSSRVAMLPTFVRSRPSRTRWTMSLKWARSDSTTRSIARPSAGRASRRRVRCR